MIRKAKVEDAGGIARCLQSAFQPFRSQYTEEAFLDTALNHDAVLARMLGMTVYVAIAPGGEIVGTLASSLEGSAGHLRGMAVLPAWQGHSIADQLLRAAERDLASAGCTRVTLDTTVVLERAIRFYERNRYAASGRIGDFFGMPLHEYVKRLT